MSSQINIKKQRIRIITTGLLLIASAVLMFVGVDKFSDVTIYYISPEDPTVEFKYEGHKYYLNGVELEIVETAWQQDALRGIPAMSYILPGLLAAFLAVYLVSKLPPLFIWPGILFGNRRKEHREGRISLKQAPGGLIATRCWDVDKAGILSSTARNVEWDSAVLEADINPVVGGWHGVYAYRLGTDFDGREDVEGLVSLSGRIVGHKDSLLRAQKCTILVLVTKKEKIAPLLGQRYKCPVVVTPDIKRTIQNWIISQEGIFWLAHNEKILGKKLQDKFENDITAIPAYQEF